MYGNRGIGEKKIGIFNFSLILLLASQAALACSRDIKYGGVSYEVCIADFSKYHVRTYWKGSDTHPIETLTRLWSVLQTDHPRILFATNAGIFMDDLTPLGLYVENGREFRPLNKRRGLYGNFYLQPNGVMAVWPNGRTTISTTGQFSSHRAGKPLYATQSGPMLVIDGKINKAFKADSINRLVRSGVGVTASAAIIVKSNGPVSFFEFARLFRDKFGAHEALYLDGNISDTVSATHGPEWSGQRFGAMIAVTLK